MYQYPAAGKGEAGIEMSICDQYYKIISICVNFYYFCSPKTRITAFAKASAVKAGCGAVGSVLRSGRRGRKFESSHPDK